MNSYYFKNIINQIIKKKSDTIIIFFLVFVATILLSIVVFFKYNDSISDSINNNLKLEYQISNNNLFGTSTNRSNEIFTSNYVTNLSEITDYIDNFDGDGRVKEYGYNLVLSYKSIENNELIFFGTSNLNSVERFNLKLIDGRYLNNDELGGTSNNILISSEIKINGLNLNVGDKLKIVDEYNQEEMIEFNIVGIYERKNINTSFKTNTIFNDYSNTVIISNEYIKDYIKKYKDKISYDKCFLNDIYIDLNDYTNYDEFGKELSNGIIQINRNTIPNANLCIDDLNNNSILNKTSSINDVFVMIFYIIFILIITLLLGTLSYLIKKKSNEIYTYYTLGQSKIKVILHYVVAYVIIALLAIIAGLIVGYFIAYFMSYMLKINSSININIFKLKIENITSSIPKFNFDFYSIFSIIIVIISSVIISIFLCVNHIYNQILKKKRAH